MSTGGSVTSVVANLGRWDVLKASGQLEPLAGSFARLDPPMAGTRRDVGSLLLVARMLAELELVRIVDGRSGALDAGAAHGR